MGAYLREKVRNIIVSIGTHRRAYYITCFISAVIISGILFWLIFAPYGIEIMYVWILATIITGVMMFILSHEKVRNIVLYIWTRPVVVNIMCLMLILLVFLVILYKA